MILLKPCPPCCTSTPSTYPSIYVPDDFWTYGKSKKLMVLQTIAANRTDLADTLSEPIATLEGGTDLVRGV
ncbi:MAG TPA: hypothetical protein VEV83_07180 [Parafilimonas sp.]|nr:hypothetical protein [Parafilimonas sp.]